MKATLEAVPTKNKNKNGKVMYNKNLNSPSFNLFSWIIEININIEMHNFKPISFRLFPNIVTLFSNPKPVFIPNKYNNVKVIEPNTKANKHLSQPRLTYSI